MKKSIALAALAAALIAPAAARADWGIRGGLEAPLTTHSNDFGSYSISDSFQPALNILVQKGPSDFIALGVEARVNFVSTNNFTRTGTSLAPEVMINVPVLPFYVRGSLPIRIEPHAADLGLRLAAGFKINLPFVGIYLEVAGDTPLVGNDVAGNSETAFKVQVISAGAGAEFRF